MNNILLVDKLMRVCYYFCDKIVNYLLFVVNIIKIDKRENFFIFVIKVV